MAQFSAAITAESLSFQFDDGRVLFEDLKIALGPSRYGLVGRNGTGKSVLAQILAGRRQPSSGHVEWHSTLGFMPQDAADRMQGTVADMLGATARLSALARIEAGGVDPADFETVGEGWTLREDLCASLQDFGLSADLSEAVERFSGGERTRLALLALELQAPEFLILDEPTNHMDRAGRQWLAERLSLWGGGVLIVTHDRELLGSVEEILELSTLGLVSYGGNYELYRIQKETEISSARQTLASAEAAQARERRGAQARKERQAQRDAYGRKQRGTGSQSKMLLDAAKARAEASVSRLTRIEENRREGTQAAADAARAAVERVDPLRVTLPVPAAAQGVLLALRNVALAYGGAALRKGLSFQVAAGERVALVGSNGAGKSTVMRLIDGSVEPQSGEVWFRAQKWALLDQHLSFLNAKQTALENLQVLEPDLSQSKARTRLAQLRLRGDRALLPTEVLSGGERLKVALAAIFGGETGPSLLLLDEPDNHLDFESLAALEEALRDYDGALLVVSHSESFLTAIGVERRIDLDIVL